MIRIGVKPLIFTLLLGFLNNVFGQTLELNSQSGAKYHILISSNAPSSVNDAAITLQHYLQKTLDVKLNIVAKASSAPVNYISLGLTDELKSANLNYTGIINDGFKTISANGNLYIYGYDTPDGELTKDGGVSNGTANGIYSFIENYLGVRWLMPGPQGEYIPKLNSIKIPSLNKVENSPFNYRIIPYLGAGKMVEDWEKRLKALKTSDLKYDHAWAETIPASAYDEHPTWFAQKKGKYLPPSDRYKLETTNPELVKAFADTLIVRFKKDPDLKWQSLSPSDGWGDDWSDNPEAVALLEKDPTGKISRTRLILKFYNDVAKIVGKQFPDRKLGGYIYSNYMYPPSDGIPKLEPNLGLMLATSNSYGFQLYRQSTKDVWDSLAKAWGEAAKKNGCDIYFYDLPTAIMQHNGILQPPAPEILNFQYSRLAKYGFKGTFIYGRPVWPVYGPGNYAIAKLNWNPKQNAEDILNEYYDKAYGKASGKHIAKLFNVLDSAFRKFYIKHTNYGYSLNTDHLKEIYGPQYTVLEKHYLQAWNVKTKDAKQQERLRLFGEVLGLMQWNLRTLGYLNKNYKSALTYTDKQADEKLLSADLAGLGIAEQYSRLTFPEPVKTVPVKRSNKEGKITNPVVPIYMSVRTVLYVPETGIVSIKIKELETGGEFQRYILTEPDGKELSAGVIYNGRNIEFKGEAGKSYIMDIPSRKGFTQLEISGASVAYKTDREAARFFSGIRINADRINDTLALYSYVPSSVKDPGFTLGNANLDAAKGVIADLYSPEGVKVARLDTRSKSSDRFVGNNNIDGFWKIVIHQVPDAKKPETVSLTLDKRIPQYVMPESPYLLKIKDTSPLFE